MHGENIRLSLVRFFESLGHHLSEAENGAQASAMLAESRFDLVLTDFRMAEMNGLELLKEAKRVHPDTLVILMTAYATVESAVAAMKAGAYDYVTKPFSLTEMQLIVERALHLQDLQMENRELREAMDDLPLLDSRAPAMTRLLETAKQAAASDATILLTGESGTGKNVIARQVHRWSLRHDRMFVVVNCTTLSEWSRSKANCSVTFGEHSPARSKTNPGGLKRPMAGPSSSMRSRTYPLSYRPNFYVSCRNKALSA